MLLISYNDMKTLSKAVSNDMYLINITARTILINLKQLLLTNNYEIIVQQTKPVQQLIDISCYYSHFLIFHRGLEKLTYQY